MHGVHSRWQSSYWACKLPRGLQQVLLSCADGARLRNSTRELERSACEPRVVYLAFEFAVRFTAGTAVAHRSDQLAHYSNSAESPQKVTADCLALQQRLSYANGAMSTLEAQRWMHDAVSNIVGQYAPGRLQHTNMLSKVSSSLSRHA